MSMAPSVFWCRHSKASKSHKCVECGDEIKPGERYERYTGVWDKKFNTFKTCGACVALRSALIDGGLEHEDIEFGRLHAAYEEAKRSGFRLHPLQLLAMQA